VVKAGSCFFTWFMIFQVFFDVVRVGPYFFMIVRAGSTSSSLNILKLSKFSSNPTHFQLKSSYSSIPPSQPCPIQIPSPSNLTPPQYSPNNNRLSLSLFFCDITRDGGTKLHNLKVTEWYCSPSRCKVFFFIPSLRVSCLLLLFKIFLCCLLAFLICNRDCFVGCCCHCRDNDSQKCVVLYVIYSFIYLKKFESIFRLFFSLKMKFENFNVENF
jgi:hypothetical protein